METEKMNAYQASVKKRLAELTPYLEQYAIGDFTQPIPLPEEEDDFTELVESINRMATDFHAMLHELAATENKLRRQKDMLNGIANTSPALIYVYDLETQSNVYANPGIETLLGYSPQEIQEMGAKLFPTIIHPDDLMQVYAFQRRVALANDDEVLEIKYRMQHTDGSWHTFHSIERPFLRQPNGTVKQKVGIALDITSEINMSAALRESEDRLRLAIDAAKLGIFDFDLTTGEVQVSDEWLIMLDYEPGHFDLDFEKWVNMLHPDDVEHTLQVYQDYIAGKTDFYHAEFRMQTQNGDYRWIQANGRVIERDAAGKPLRMLGTHTNIDQRKRREQKEQQYRQQLEASNQRMRAFNRMAVGRENKMVELKQEVNALCEQLGMKPRYSLDFLETQGESQ